MIKPTVGRVVWYRPSETERMVHIDNTQPLAAIITHVWTDSCVNLAVFDSKGKVSGRRSVHLKQSPEERVPAPQSYCEWMPYQIGQATKH